jgi:hypothetical protein
VRRLAFVLLLAFVLSCNALVGAPDPVALSADGASDAHVLPSADAGSPDGASPDASTSSDSAIADALTDPPDEEQFGPPVRVGTGYGRTVSAVADPGTTGSVYFGDFDYGTVYRFDKATGQVAALPQMTYNVAGLVTNANNVYWTSPFSNRLAWATRSGSTGGSLLDSAYGATWKGPWMLAIDTQSLFWCNRYGFDIWKMDLGFANASRIYSEELPDGAPGMEQLWGSVAADPGPGGYVFFSALRYLNRMNKDGTGLSPFGRVGGQTDVVIDGSFVYWVDQTGSLVRAPESGCTSPGCPQVIVPGTQAQFAGHSAFDATYVYWNDGAVGAVSRARKDGTSAAPEHIAYHTAISGIGVDDVAIYYTTQWDIGPDGGAISMTGSFWRIAR